MKTGSRRGDGYSPTVKKVTANAPLLGSDASLMLAASRYVPGERGGISMIVSA